MGKHPCLPQFKLQVLYKHSQNVDEEVIKIKAFSFLLLAHLLHGHFNCSIYLTVNRKKSSLRGNNFLRESPIEILKLFAARTFASAYLVRWFKDLAPYARRFSLRWWDREGSRDSSKRSLLNINWPKGWLVVYLRRKLRGCLTIQWVIFHICPEFTKICNNFHDNIVVDLPLLDVP